MSKITPYNNSKTKKAQVQAMFDNIAKNYDLLNHTLSAGLHNIWRKKAIQKLTNNPKTRPKIYARLYHLISIKNKEKITGSIEG